jgi:hypothetical protein
MHCSAAPRPGRGHAPSRGRGCCVRLGPGGMRTEQRCRHAPAPGMPLHMRPGGPPVGDAGAPQSEQPDAVAGDMTKLLMVLGEGKTQSCSTPGQLPRSGCQPPVCAATGRAARPHSTLGPARAGCLAGRTDARTHTRGATQGPPSTHACQAAGFCSWVFFVMDNAAHGARSLRH